MSKPPSAPRPNNTPVPTIWHDDNPDRSYWFSDSNGYESGYYDTLPDLFRAIARRGYTSYLLAGERSRRGRGKHVVPERQIRQVEQQREALNVCLARIEASIPKSWVWVRFWLPNQDLSKPVRYVWRFGKLAPRSETYTLAREAAVARIVDICSDAVLEPDRDDHIGDLDILAVGRQWFGSIHMAR